MSRYPLWKYILVILVMVYAVVYTLPNFYETYPSINVTNYENRDLSKDELTKLIEDKSIPYMGVDGRSIFFKSIDDQLSAFNKLSSDQKFKYTLSNYNQIPKWLNAINAQPVSLGLDLKGGVHFLLQIDTENVRKSRANQLETNLRNFLIDNGVRYSNVINDNSEVKFVLINKNINTQTLDALSDTFSDYDISLLEEGEQKNIVARLSEESFADDVKASMTKNLAILRSRVDELGVSQPIIQRQGKDRIIVQLPGLQDSTRAKNILGSTATLEFRLTKGSPDDWTASDTIGTNTVSESILYRHKNGSPVLLSRNVIASGKDIEGANSGFDSQTNQPAVFVNLSSFGASNMLETTSRNIGNTMAVVFVEQDKSEIINVATIREAFSKRFQITGIDMQEAKDLAILLRSGSLSAPMSIIEERTVGPSLGSENIISGRDSMILGMILVILFMFIYYKNFGLVANLALIANILIITATLSLFQATLTLSGIAGIVLTVGMAVDANVLIYERIREELFNGNSPNASIISGYNKAFSTISDANITTLIAAIALLTIGTGVVKGFAVTLVIGILSSMFTAIIGTRAIISIIYENKTNKGLSI
ncbi:MAG: protein translocase subunit SecD [Pseudomonadota bacterium]|nr:protein translocase subunit SecD [Pseudomonadota bacterium]